MHAPILSLVTALLSVVSLGGCGSSRPLSSLTAARRLTICQPIADQIGGAFGCTARTLSEGGAGVETHFKFTAETVFKSNGRLSRYSRLRPVGELMSTSGHAPDCVARELKRLSLEALADLPQGLSVPLELEFVVSDHKGPPTGAPSEDGASCIITISSPDS